MREALARSHGDFKLSRNPRAAAKPAGGPVRGVVRGTGRFLLLWFLEEDPRTNWARSFAPEPDRVASSDLAVTTFMAPFIPTLPGTDRYVDELR